jgi:hypothetical protein
MTAFPLTIGTLSCLLLSTTLTAENTIQKRSIKANNVHVYHQLPPSVEDFSQMFSEGMFYGRIRSNTFNYVWEKEIENEQYNHTASGLGGSAIFKSGTFKDFDFTTALYGAYAFYDIKNDDVSRFRTGVDVMSRYNYVNDKEKHMLVLGEAFLNYSGFSKSNLRIGRQMVEGFSAKSNDTKMIPNTFDGIVLNSDAIDNTYFQLAYLTQQKLRSHTFSHAILAVGDATSSNQIRPEWSENDDSAMHRGLTFSALKAKGLPTDSPLITAEVSNDSISNTNLKTAMYSVPDLLSQIVAEANYNIDMSGEFTLSPGVRYLKQLDNGAGKAGGAALYGGLAGLSGAQGGYKDASSLDSQMIAARLVGKYQNYKITLAYTNILDESDLITPWRGFPTSGYTRSMARYHWQANTKNYRLELVKNSFDSGLYKDMFMQLSVLHTDRDEDKNYFDENYYYAGFVKNIPELVDLQWRLRLGYHDTEKDDGDGLDSRFELNYLF